MEIHKPSAQTENIWSGILALSSVGGSLMLACMFPFAAIATLLAATLPFRKAMAWMGGAWFANQVVGYLILGYPQTATSFGHGLAIGATALATVWVAKTIFNARGDQSLVSTGLAFAGAFVAYEGLLLVAAFFLGGVQNFAPSIIWLVAQNDIAWLIGLGALYLALDRIIFPRFTARASLQN